MEAIIEYSMPDARFWEDYSHLWENSVEKSPFQAPRLLQYFAKTISDPIATYKFYIGSKLKGVALFHKKGKAYGFLSDIKTDHNSFVIHKNCTHLEVAAFFDYLHENIHKEKWVLVLNNQPMWLPYMDVFVKSGYSSRLFWLSGKSSVCPMLVQPTPEALYEKLSKSRNNRYKLNRLQREYEVAFEALTTDEGLEDWVNDFCETHIRRWADTKTPSKYLNPERRVLLLNCLKAWQQEGVLTRFALKANGKRIAFVIGLTQKTTLIYHALTHHPDYNKHSPSLALVIFLGEWMKKHGFNVLDFGDGNESYKYNFANEEGQLNSIFIGPKSNLSFVLRSKFIAAVRDNPTLIRLYREKARPIVRWIF